MFVTKGTWQMNLFKYLCWLFRESTDNLVIFANIKLLKTKVNPSSLKCIWLIKTLEYI